MFSSISVFSLYTLQRNCWDMKFNGFMIPWFLLFIFFYSEGYNLFFVLCFSMYILEWLCKFHKISTAIIVRILPNGYIYLGKKLTSSVWYFLSMKVTYIFSIYVPSQYIFKGMLQVIYSFDSLKAEFSPQSTWKLSVQQCVKQWLSPTL